MNTIVACTLKDVYGKTLAYPANEQAKRLAALVGSKTLTVSTLKQAHEMGFSLHYVDRFGAFEAWSPSAFALRIA